MATKKISAMTVATVIDGTESIPIVQTTNKRVTPTVLLNGLYDIPTGNIVVKPVNAAGFGAIVATESATAGVLNGVNYVYVCTFLTATGETGPTTVSNAISVTNKQVNLTNLPVSADTRVTGRNIYRIATATASHLLRLVDTIAAAGTTYTDNTADADLGVYVPRVNSTGGMVYLNTDRSIVVDANLTALGFQAHPGTTGYANVAIGYQAMYSNTIGSLNTAIGVYALYSNVTGSNNVSIGTHSLNYSTVSNNVAIGKSACEQDTTGTGNLGIGTNALQLNTTGSYNIGIGMNALQILNGGSNNTVVGYGAMIASTGGNHNTAVGLSALATNATGWYNVAIGYQAGLYETGSYKLFIDGLYRASEALGRSDSLIYGVFAAAPANQYLFLNAAHINMAYLPTAAAGLAVGDLWNNGGVLTVVLP